jgi:hypothetical protein
MSDFGSISGTQLVSGIVIGFLVVGAVLFFLLQQSPPSIPSFQDDSCQINESGMLIDPCVPLFKIINGTYDTVSQGDRDWNDTGKAPSPEECPGFVKKALKPFGGLPDDAKFSSIDDTASGGTYNGTTGIETMEVLERCVHYRQFLYGIPVKGHGGGLTVCLTNDGEPDLISKHWRSVEEVGMEQVIPASEAIVRLKNHDGRFNPPTKTLIYDYIPDSAFNLTITGMKIGYFASNNSANETYLEPVWTITTVDNIRRMPFIFYVPASYQPVKYAHLKSDFFGNQRNFSQVKGNLTAVNISYSQNVLIGTSGPVGKDAAQRSVREFIENPESNLTYNGRFRSSSSVCGGGYQGEYYSIDTRDCHFMVDVYSGSIISASINESCIKPGFSGKSVSGNITSENADTLARNFAREKYPFYDKRHIISNHKPYFEKSTYGDYYLISYSGDFGTISESGVYVSVRYRDGLIYHYSISDDDLQYLSVCEGSVVRIDE